MNREREIDIMKGITILLVIFGHFYGSKVINIFHMPLFYFISGYFFHQKKAIADITTNARKLLFPYLGVCSAIFVSFLLFDKTKAIIFLKDAIFGECIDNQHGVLIGPVWFLSIFWCKSIYNLASRLISTSLILISSCLLTTMVVLFAPYTNYLGYPYFVTTIPVGLFFYSLGLFWKENGKRFFPFIKRPIPICLVAATILTFFQLKEPSFNISISRLTFFPLCLLNAYLFIYITYCICLRLNYIQGGYFTMVW